MRRAGDVVRIAQGKLVVRVPGGAEARNPGYGDSDGGDGDHPPIGATLVDEELREVGRVVDVFGPVVRPYLTAVPDDDVTAPELLGERLYARE